MNRQIRSELVKILSARAFYGILVLVALWSGSLAVITASLAGNSLSPDQFTTSVGTAATVRDIYGAGTRLTDVLALSYGILLITNEYRYGTIQVTLLSSGGRSAVYAAKSVLAILLGGLLGLASVISAISLGAGLITARGGESRLTSTEVLVPLGLSVLGTALWCVIGLGIGAAVRHQIPAVLAGVAVLFFVDPLLTAVAQSNSLSAAAAYFPSQVSTALLTRDPATAGEVPLLPWGIALLTLAGYALMASVIGRLSVGRDVA